MQKFMFYGSFNLIPKWLTNILLKIELDTRQSRKNRYK